MHLIKLLLGLALAILLSATQDTWPIPTLDLTALASEGIITLTPFTTTGPAPTLATPTGVANPHAASSCTAQPWTMRQVNAFHADPNGEAVNYSHVEFYFDDPNLGLTSYCTHDFAAGTGQVGFLEFLVDEHVRPLIRQQGPVDTENWYPCYNFGMSFLYAGSIMGLRRHFECNGYVRLI